MTGPELEGGDVASPTLVGLEHGHLALVGSSGALGAMAMRGQPGLAFEVLINGLAVAMDALACEQRMDAPIAIAGRTLNQHLLDGWGSVAVAAAGGADAVGGDNRTNCEPRRASGRSAQWKP